MASSEETTHYVDRCESLLKSPLASQINANKSLIREFGYSDVEESSNAVEAHASFSTDGRERTLSKTEISEVHVDIQGLRETMFSSSETVVTNRIRTVYDRSLSGSTSSTELDHKESFAEAYHEPEDAVFGETGHIDGEKRERKTSDSYYISQTYQVNTEAKSSKSVTAVRTVSFRSSKDLEIGNHDRSSEDSDLHFVDHLEERIAGVDPDVVGSPKEKHVRFLWYDNDQEDIEALKRIQSSRENVQQLIESTYMVSDIADVIDDNCMGPESKHLAAATGSDNLWLAEDSQVGQSTERKYEVSIEQANQKSDVTVHSGRTETQDPNITTQLASETSQDLYVQTVSASDVAQMIDTKSSSSAEVTWGLDVTSYASIDGTQRFDTSHSVSYSITKPTNFSTEFEPLESLTTGRASPPTMAYSPGMAIRSYALEELAEKKCMVPSDKIEAEATSPKTDNSSGLASENRSFNDDLSSLNTHSITQLTNMQNASGESHVEDSSNTQQQTASNGNFPVEEMSKEEDDESLDKLVDLESLLIGYRFHDVGIMQESGGICNLAFDDSDEHENVLVSSSEYRSSSLHPGDVANIDVSLSEAVPLDSSDIRSQFLTENNRVSPYTQGLHSALEHSTTSLPKSSDASIRATSYAQDTSTLASAIQEHPPEIKSPGTAEANMFTTEFSHKSIKSENASTATTQVETRRTIFQGEDVSHTVERVHQSSRDSSDEKLEHTPGASQDCDADSENIVKELDSIIEAGEKAIQEISQSLEKEEFETLVSESRESQWQTENTEDLRKSKEAEVNYGIQAGKYSPGTYFSADKSPNLLKERQDNLHLSTDRRSGASIDVVDNATYSRSGKASVYGTDAQNVEYTKEVDNAVRKVKMDYSGSVKDDRSSAHKRNIDSTLSSIENNHVTNFSKTENASPIEAGKKPQIKETVKAAKTRKDKNTRRTKEVGKAQKKNQNTTNFIESEEKIQVHEVGAVTIQTSAHAHNISNSSFGEMKYAAHAIATENHTIIEVAKVETKNVKVPACVTRRFNVSSKFEATLKSQGAVLKSESMSIAVYYDTPEFDLTLSDCWLRSVNSKWQFHSNFTKLLNNLTKQEYSESEDRQDILSFITALLKRPVPAEPDISVAMIVQRSGLREFARYTTRKKTYALKGMMIDLELPEYGFWVGSVTVTVSSQSKLHDAVSRIDSFWKTTGVHALNLLVG